MVTQLKKSFDLFYHKETIKLGKGGAFERVVDFELLVGTRAANDILDNKGKVLLRRVRKSQRWLLRKSKKLELKSLPATLEDVVGKVVAEDIFNEETGEVVCLANEELTEAKIQEISGIGYKEIPVLYIDNVNFGDQIRNTFFLIKQTLKKMVLLKSLKD